ncbi:MAG: hypothetical protein EA427_03235 [Spirochaetaceae bacterium]|nr:MAG: hypothetical protein EA427_03235 [Spirochaetaceae bacterium]
MLFPRVIGAVRKVFARYRLIHGSLLAKGLSFSVLFAMVPLLFLFTLAGSIALTPEVQALLEREILHLLPEGARQSITMGLQRFARTPGSLSVATVPVFLYTVHVLFFDIHKMVRAAFGIPVGTGTGRLRALALNGIFLLLIYVSALLTVSASIAAPYLAVPSWLLQLLARASALGILASVVWSMIRVSSGVKLHLRYSVPVALTAAVAWQVASFAAGVMVRATARRVLVYGVLTSAISILALTRVYAEIVLHAALWMAELDPVYPAEEGINGNLVDRPG